MQLARGVLVTIVNVGVVENLRALFPQSELFDPNFGAQAVNADLRQKLEEAAGGPLNSFHVERPGAERVQV